MRCGTTLLDPGGAPERPQRHTDMPQADSDGRCRTREFYQPRGSQLRPNARPSDKETTPVSSPAGVLRTGGARRTECDSRSHGPAAQTSFGRTAHVSVVAMIDSTGSAI